jgi:translation initiation factor IF-3
MILDRLAEELADLAVIEQRPIQDGRNMTMMLGPSKAVLSGEIDQPAAEEAPEPEAAVEAPAADAPVAAADAPADEPDTVAAETDAPAGEHDTAVAEADAPVAEADTKA